MIGTTIGDLLGLEGLLLFGTALLFAVVGAIVFLALSRVMLRLATAMLGAYLVSWGAYSISMRIGISAKISMLLAVIAFIMIALSGFISQSGWDKKKQGPDRRRDRKGDERSKSR